MYDLFFLKILNMSITASWLILAVMLLRLLFKKAPKWIVCLLWALVAIRLICPFSVESALSLIPSAETFDAHNVQFETPKIHTGIDVVNHAVNPVLAESFSPAPGASVNPLHVWVFVAGIIWTVGMVLLLLYALMSYICLCRTVREAVPLRENIYLCDTVQSPFILGVFRPKVYLPSGIQETTMEPVIAHEQAHIARRDHWWKPLGFLILSIHWFNPLCWVSYILLCRDIELACDEKVIHAMDMSARKEYSTALLECSVRRRMVTVCPLAFGEVGVKARIKSVLHYKQPAFWLAAAAVMACVIAAVCFLTNPLEKKSYIRLAETDTYYFDISRCGTSYSRFETHWEGDTLGILIAEWWNNGKCIRTNSITLSPDTEQILCYLLPVDAEDNAENVHAKGVAVQLRTENTEPLIL